MGNTYSLLLMPFLPRIFIRTLLKSNWEHQQSHTVGGWWSVMFTGTHPDPEKPLHVLEVSQMLSLNSRQCFWAAHSCGSLRIWALPLSVPIPHSVPCSCSFIFFWHCPKVGLLPLLDFPPQMHETQLCVVGTSWKFRESVCHSGVVGAL